MIADWKELATCPLVSMKVLAILSVYQQKKFYCVFTIFRHKNVIGKLHLD